MYQPSVPCGDQEPLLFGFSWRRTLVSGGASGVLLKLKTLLIYAYEEIFGLVRALRSKFRVMSACGRRQSHLVIENFGSREQSPTIKWF